MADNGFTISDCPAYVLAGGHSKRFGSSKAREVVEGRTQLERLTETLLSYGHDVTVVAATYWLEAASRLAPILDEQSTVLHAGEAETSMMLHLTPELVDDSDLASLKTEADLSFLAVGEGSYRWRDLTAVTPNGVLGDPSTASATKGELLLEAASDAIADLITSADTWAPPPDLRGPETGGVSF